MWRSHGLVTMHFKHSHWWKRRSRSNFDSHYAWGTDRWSEYVWMQDGCRVYTNSYMASNGSCFVVTWTVFKNHLSEVGLTQNRETMALWMFTTFGYFLLYHMWGPAWIEIHWNNIWLRARYMWLHTTLEGPWPHYMILEVCWNGLWTRSFGLSQFHGHGSWLVCEMTLRS